MGARSSPKQRTHDLALLECETGMTPWSSNKLVGTMVRCIIKTPVILHYIEGETTQYFPFPHTDHFIPGETYLVFHVIPEFFLSSWSDEDNIDKENGTWQEKRNTWALIVLKNDRKVVLPCSYVEPVE